jgi:hypothetical protein
MRFIVKPTQISHDRLQDEVIIINVGSGAYYSGSGPAADVWSILTGGSTIADAARVLASAYSAQEDTVARDLETAVNFLIERGLIESVSGNGSASIALPEAVRGEWMMPQFDEYTDMWELIKLDPIHETDEVGWPVAKA